MQRNSSYPITSVRPETAAEHSARRLVNQLLRVRHTAEEYYWLRFDVAEWHLEAQGIPAAAQAALVRDSAYWAWFRRQWQLNDLEIVREWTAEFTDGWKMSQSEYEAYQREFFSKRFINRATLDVVASHLPAGKTRDAIDDAFAAVEAYQHSHQPNPSHYA